MHPVDTRHEEVKSPIKRLNRIIGNWEKDMGEDDYYSLRAILLKLLNYSLEGGDIPSLDTPICKKYDITLNG